MAAQPTLAALRLVVGLSVIGILWTLAHPLMEVLMGSATLFIGPAIVLAGGWGVCLLALFRWLRWPLAGLLVFGVLTLITASGHFPQPGVHAVWLAVLPWMSDAWGTGPRWSIAYNGLMYAGMLVGLAVIWSAAATLDMSALSRAVWAGFAGVLGLAGGLAGAFVAEPTMAWVIWGLATGLLAWLAVLSSGIRGRPTGQG